MAGNTFGKIFKVTTFGESHGPALGLIVDGCPPGIAINENDIQLELNRRKPGQSAVTTARKEADKVEILSGTFQGQTTGTPIAMVVYNKDADSSKYEKIKHFFRPGHADLSYFLKYGIRDYNGGGRASGRATLSRVAAGAIAKKILAKQGIHIIGHTLKAGAITAREFNEAEIESNPVRCADKNAAGKMIGVIEQAKKEGDSIGGVVEVIAKGVPPGLGEPVFDKLDAEIAKALVSIPAAKGVEIGAGFRCAEMKGSEMNDEIAHFNGEFQFRTNNAGGINGGISNGADVVARVAVRPTPSISKPQTTVDLNGKEEKIKIEGRHDPCICPRFVPVAEAMLALTILDLLLIHNSRCKQ